MPVKEKLNIEIENQEQNIADFLQSFDVLRGIAAEAAQSKNAKKIKQVRQKIEEKSEEAESVFGDLNLPHNSVIQKEITQLYDIVSGKLHPAHEQKTAAEKEKKFIDFATWLTENYQKEIQTLASKNVSNTKLRNEFFSIVEADEEQVRKSLRYYFGPDETLYMQQLKTMLGEIATHRAISLPVRLQAFLEKKEVPRLLSVDQVFSQIISIQPKRIEKLSVSYFKGNRKNTDIIESLTTIIEEETQDAPQVLASWQQVLQRMTTEDIMQHFASAVAMFKPRTNKKNIPHDQQEVIVPEPSPEIIPVKNASQEDGRHLEGMVIVPPTTDSFAEVIDEQMGEKEKELSVEQKINAVVAELIPKFEADPDWFAHSNEIFKQARKSHLHMWYLLEGMYQHYGLTDYFRSMENDEEILATAEKNQQMLISLGEELRRRGIFSSPEPVSRQEILAAETVVPQRYFITAPQLIKQKDGPDFTQRYFVVDVPMQDSNEIMRFQAAVPLNADIGQPQQLYEVMKKAVVKSGVLHNYQYSQFDKNRSDAPLPIMVPAKLFSDIWESSVSPEQKEQLQARKEFLNIAKPVFDANPKTFIANNSILDYADVDPLVGVFYLADESLIGEWRIPERTEFEDIKNKTLHELIHEAFVIEAHRQFGNGNLSEATKPQVLLEVLAYLINVAKGRQKKNTTSPARPQELVTQQDAPPALPVEEIVPSMPADAEVDPLPVTEPQIPVEAESTVDSSMQEPTTEPLPSSINYANRTVPLTRISQPDIEVVNPIPNLDELRKKYIQAKYTMESMEGIKGLLHLGTSKEKVLREYEQARAVYEQARAEYIGSHVDRFLDEKTKLVEENIRQYSKGRATKFLDWYRRLSDYNLLTTYERAHGRVENKWGRFALKSLNVRTGILAVLGLTGFAFGPASVVGLSALMGRRLSSTTVSGGALYDAALMARNGLSRMQIEDHLKKPVLHMDDIETYMAQLEASALLQGKTAEDLKTDEVYNELTKRYEQVVSEQAAQENRLEQFLDRQISTVDGRLSDRIKNEKSKRLAIAAVAAVAGGFISSGFFQHRVYGSVGAAWNKFIGHQGTLPVEHPSHVGTLETSHVVPGHDALEVPVSSRGIEGSLLDLKYSDPAKYQAVIGWLRQQDPGAPKTMSDGGFIHRFMLRQPGYDALHWLAKGSTFHVNANGSIDLNPKYLHFISHAHDSGTLQDSSPPASTIESDHDEVFQ